MGGDPLPERINALLSQSVDRRDHAVLASVSRGYPPLKGTLVTLYSPVRRSTRLPKETFAHDLHA